MDLSTRYLGLDLKNPFVPSSTPLSKNIDSARQLEDAGASALVMHSIFQEQIESEDAATDSSIAGSDLFSSAGAMPSAEQYLEQFRQLETALDIPVIPSLNGTCSGDWVSYAAELEVAGARALELNVYYVAADITESSESVEGRVIDIFRSLRECVDLPIGVKLSPYFSSLGNMVRLLEANGAAGISLFNRFYQPTIDLQTMEISSALELSTSGDALLAMRWIAILHGRVQLSLAATGGIHFAEDALKALMCGADITCLGSTLLANGPEQLTRIRDNTVHWLQERGYDSVNQVRGALSQANAEDPAAFARGHYLQMLSDYKV